VSWEESQQLVDWPECLEFFQFQWMKVLASVEETKARPLLAELVIAKTLTVSLLHSLWTCMCRMHV